MFDIPSHCETREKELAAAGLHIQTVLDGIKVDRSTWTGWKCREILPRLSKLRQVDEAIDRALAEARRGDAA